MEQDRSDIQFPFRCYRTPKTPDTVSERVSVALFHLDPGHASPLSHNRQGKEAFLILSGHGSVLTGTVAHPVGPGSYILVQPATRRSIRADRGTALTFYAITAPAWSPTDDVIETPPGLPVGDTAPRLSPPPAKPYPPAPPHP